MLSHVYRFRPLERLLDKNELLNQEVYFASPAQLNDPMEGFRDIVWQGDAVLWCNLFRHYVLCLECACVLLMVGGEAHPISWDMIPVVNRGDTGATPRHAAKLNRILDQVLDHPDMRALTAALASRKVPVRRSELAAVLHFVHGLAIVNIDRVHQRSGAHQDATGDAQLREALRHAVRMAEHVGMVETEHANAELVIPALFDAQAHTLAQLSFIQLYNAPIDSTLPNRNFVFRSFPQEHVKQIEALVYPEWYAACFMLECKNPAIWGTYGGAHNGVCLKFKVSEMSGRATLRLHRKAGYSSVSGDTSGWVDHEFHPIIYDRAPAAVSFFRMLGRIPKPTIERDWYTDRQGARSTLTHDMLPDEDAWRQRYWQEFETGVTTKLADWRHEQEYRLVLTPLVLDFSDAKSRTARYRFRDLDGIIFGIRTPTEQKIRICRIIEEKCRAEQRSDFRFYQAFHSSCTGLVEHAELSLLNFAPD